MNTPTQNRNPRGRVPLGWNRTWLAMIGIVLVLGVAAVLAVVATGGDDAARPAARNETGTVAVSGEPLLPFTGAGDDEAIGATIPTVSGVAFDGSPITVEPTGRPMMIVFLAHWCPHCQAEVPRLVDLARQGGLDGVDVMTVATGTDSRRDNYPPSTWLRDEEWPFAVLADSPQYDSAVAYGLTSVPYFVFVAADGTVAGRAVGEISNEDVGKIVEALRAGEPLPAASGASSSAD